MREVMLRLLMVLAVTAGPGSAAVCAETLYLLPDNAETRWASPENFGAERAAGGQRNAGRKGSANFRLNKGESRVLAEVKGASGVVRRIWMTIGDRSPEMLRCLRLDIFWDEANVPAVSAPLGDFFCHGLGRMSAFESALFSSPEGRSFNCYAQMPFKAGMRIVLTNESRRDLDAVYYDVDFTVGDKHPENMLYFHAHWRRENPTTLQKDFEILPRVEGAGRFIGANIGVAADQRRYFKSWWGEGEVKVYLDGDRELPTLCGTGTEDYIGSAWGQGHFANMYQGCTIADQNQMRFCFYRWHIPDPVYFRKDVRVTIHQIGCWDPKSSMQLGALGEPVYLAGPGLVDVDFRDPNLPAYGLYERQDDWSCCTYFYLDKPVNGLPDLAPVRERVVGL